MALPHENRSLPPETGHLVVLWLTLLALGAIELGLSFLPWEPGARPLVILPAMAMIVVVAVGFMNVTKGPTIVRAFAIAALFWLLVLLGLGSVDVLTRIDFAG